MSNLWATMRSIRQSLFIGLFCVSWSLAQLALIDHVYTSEHLNDTVCEWCVNLSHSNDSALIAEQASILNAVATLSVVDRLPVSPTLQASPAPYLTRAPPLFLS